MTYGTVYYNIKMLRILNLYYHKNFHAISFLWNVLDKDKKCLHAFFLKKCLFEHESDMATENWENKFLEFVLFTSRVYTSELWKMLIIQISFMECVWWTFFPFPPCIKKYNKHFSFMELYHKHLCLEVNPGFHNQIVWYVHDQSFLEEKT